MIKWFRGDADVVIWELTVNGIAHDLVDVTTITFTYRKQDGTTKNLTGAKYDSPNGLISFNVDSNFFDEVGTFPFDIQLVYNDALPTKRTFVKDTITVEDDVNKQ